MASAPPSRFTRTLLMLSGFCSLAMIPAIWVAHDDTARLGHSQLLAQTAASKTGAGLGELLSRFERVTGTLRPQDFGDTTSLSARLLRAEPQLAPAMGLTVQAARTGAIAGTSPASADTQAAMGRVVSALGADGRAAFLPTPHNGDMLLARRIEDGVRMGGVAVSTVPADALRAIAVPLQPLQGRVGVRILDESGRELASFQPPSAAPAEPSLPDRLRAMLPASWAAPALATAEGAAGGLRWQIEAPVPPMALPPILLPLFWCVLAMACLGILARSHIPHSAHEALKRKLDEARNRSDRVLAAIGHDVRTPINSILGISGLLMDGNLDDGQRKWTGRIRASCEALLAMLNGMLEIAAAGMDGAEVHKEAVDVATLVEEVGEVLRPQAHDKGLDLQVVIDPAVLGAWNTDPTRLRQVLFNLAGNAIKYTAAGSVTIEVQPRELSPGKAQAVAPGLVIRVTDTGPGIPEDERETVFEQFRRGRDAGLQGQEGLGLGLALCREIALLLNGSIQLDTAMGAGSVFTFTIPAERLVRPRLAGGPLAGRTALVVGLSEGVRRRAASHLEQMGFSVETAADGFVTLGLAERAAFQHGCLDLLVVDAGLPGLPADVLLTRLQSTPSGDRMRTVVVSNTELPPLLRARADAVVPHPVEANVIERTVVGLFGTTSVLQELDPRAPPPTELRVLVVEDNRINQLLFVDVLQRAGLSAFAASSGEEAVEAAGRGGFDAILMDVQMPGIDGVDATTQIRAAEAAAGVRRTPILGLTAHTGAGIRKRCLDAGMDSVLHKPVDLSRLPLRVREAVSATRAVVPPVPLGADPALLDIDDEYLDMLIGEAGTERARSCIEDFRTEMVTNLPNMAGMAETDLPGLGQLAHNLAGVAGTLGVTGLLDGLLHVEDAARQGDGRAALLALHEVITTWHRVQPVLRGRFEAIAARRGGILKRVA